jgi:hypothetical protein
LPVIMPCAKIKKELNKKPVMKSILLMVINFGYSAI